MGNTKEITVDGLMFNMEKGIMSAPIKVGFTSDHGETLSLAYEDHTVILTVPYEKVEALVKRTRNGCHYLNRTRGW